MVKKENFDEFRQDSPGDSQESCSSSPSCGVDCCSPSSGGKKRSLKTAIFVVVMLLACAVAGHSLLKKDAETANVTEDAVSSFNLSERGDSSTESGVVSKEPIEKGLVLCGTNLDSVKSFTKLATEQKVDVAFILLPGADEKSAQTASTQIGAVVDKLSAQGKPVGTFTLEKDAEGHAQLVKEFSVGALPCVIVTGRGCGSVAVWGEITERNLLAAFVRTSTPVSCGGQGKSLCCPK